MGDSNSDNYDDWETINYHSTNDENTAVPDSIKTFEEFCQTESVSSLARIPVIDQRLDEFPNKENELNIDDDVNQNSEIDTIDIYHSFEIDEDDVYQIFEIDDNYYNPPNFNIVTGEEHNKSDQQVKNYLLICTNECNCRSKVGKSIILVLIILFLAAIAAYFLSGLNGENYDCTRTQVSKYGLKEGINVQDSASLLNCIFEEGVHENENVY